MIELLCTDYNKKATSIHYYFGNAVLAATPARRSFDKRELAKRGENYDKKVENILDYSDMNMRYLRISSVLQSKGRGLIIVPIKHVLAEKLAKTAASAEPIME